MSKRDYVPGTLGWWMDDRRGELRMTWDEVAEAAQVSAGSLYRIAADPEAAERMLSTTKKAIERALRWKPGSVDWIVETGRGGKLRDPVEDAAALSELRDHLVAEAPEDQPELADDRSPDAAELAELKQMAAAIRAQGEESIALAERLMARIERLDHSGEHRAAQ